MKLVATFVIALMVLISMGVLLEVQLGADTGIYTLGVISLVLAVATAVLFIVRKKAQVLRKLFPVIGVVFLSAVTGLIVTIVVSYDMGLYRGQDEGYQR